MAKAYSPDWFQAKGQELGWDVADDTSIPNGRWLTFTRQHNTMQVGFWCDIGGAWKFLRAHVVPGVVVPTVGLANKYLSEPAATLEALRAKQFNQAVWGLPPDRAQVTGAVGCCGFRWVIQKGSKIAVCKKCGKQPDVGEVA